MDKLTTTLASAACCLLMMASLVSPAQADEDDGLLGLPDATVDGSQVVDCGVSDTETASDSGEIEDPFADGDCYILGLDGVDGGTSLSLPEGVDCAGTDGPVAGHYFPAGTPPQVFQLGGDEPVVFAFVCATDSITCFSLEASTSKTGGGEASATSACSQTSAHCESGDKCLKHYEGLNEPGPWYCELYTHVKWYGGSAHASCSVTYA
jgi:hypothetical protein